MGGVDGKTINQSGHSKFLLKDYEMEQAIAVHTKHPKNAIYYPSMILNLF